MNKEKVFTRDWEGRPLTFRTGVLAKQADAAVTVQYGETVILATVVQSKEERAGTDFFPLMVEFEERLYAAGIIKGSRWVKREGRPTDEAVLTGRMIDRSVRPLFDQASRRDVQVVLTVLSVDKENDYDIVSLVAASAALSVSGVDWKGPIGGVRVGRVNNQFVFNPTYKDRLESDLDLIVAATKERVVMIEAGAKEVNEADMLNALLAGQKAMQPAIELIEEMAKELKVVPHERKIRKTEEKIDEIKVAVLKDSAEWLDKSVKHILFDQVYYTKGERKAAVNAIKEQLEDHLVEKGYDKDYRYLAIKELVYTAIEAEVTRAIIEDKKRVDGRALNEIRNLEADVDMLPRNHGAAVFSRGETQVMSIVTLGAPGDEQSLEGLEGESKKRFMLHYNFAPFSVGEAKPMRGTGRREIGHGALAEKAIASMIPSKEEFPYTIRVVAETLSSNGSSSMASTCAASLALYDAGVPIKKAVAGVAMGLASIPDMSKWEVLTDLQDLEDGEGGMDFKITGTADGITAIQLDTKTIGLDKAIMEQALVDGKAARLKVLEVMNSAISAPRAELSKYAPRISTLQIDPERIGEVIGSGGKVINEIIDACGVSIDIEDSGLVMICGVEPEGVKKAMEWVNNIVRKFEVGETFVGKVVRMLDFGAFVELVAGRDGMVHVSEMAPYRVGKPSDLISVGDTVNVRIKEIDDQGRVNLSMKGLVENEALWKDEKGKQTGDFNSGSSGYSDRPRRPRFGGR
ncbi:MAG: polyribonucleotide nucleotidyltransferase [Candidatus Falkowbacteria bacterium]|nr:polyribonucleotide nucleotidyltransferase [Candidatus Falkowbacteria bacterium]